jgi:hypothetical protein
MIVTIGLDHPHEHYTNLDVIQGRVHLRVPNPTNVSSIVVKLEGEARTRLMAPIRPDRPERQRPILEVHKILYKTEVVWPVNTRPEDLAANPKASFTINAGSYEYPFQFKVSRISPGILQMLTAIDTAEHSVSTIHESRLQCLVCQRDTRIREGANPPHQSDASAILERLPRRSRDSILCEGDG